jgi:hypothetical protein
MILITKSASNEVILTLTEKVSLENPTFLFEFKDDMTREKFYFIASDTSDQTERYNKFTVIEKVNPVALDGEVSLIRTGFYTYTVREQESETNLDPEESGEIVEVGKVKVISVEPTVYKHSIDTTTKVYNA